MDISKTSTSVMTAVTGHPMWCIKQNIYIFLDRKWTSRNTTAQSQVDLIWKYFKVGLQQMSSLPTKTETICAINVIHLCKVNDIRFVVLPPNFTHLLQPLDLSFFRPMKRAWRQTLSEWKKNHKGTLPKSQFLSFLKVALSAILMLVLRRILFFQVLKLICL